MRHSLRNSLASTDRVYVAIGGRSNVSPKAADAGQQTRDAQQQNQPDGDDALGGATVDDELSLRGREAVVLTERGLTELPDGLLMCAELQYLCLSFNALQTVDTSRLQCLRTLDVSHNALTSLCALPSTLECLRLSHNKLAQLHCVCHLANLNELWINHNDLGLEQLFALEGLNRLQVLVSEHNPLEHHPKHVPFLLAVCPSIFSLDGQPMEQAVRDQADAFARTTDFRVLKVQSRQQLQQQLGSGAGHGGLSRKPARRGQQRKAMLGSGHTPPGRAAGAAGEVGPQVEVSPLSVPSFPAFEPDAEDDAANRVYEHAQQIRALEQSGERNVASSSDQRRVQPGDVLSPVVVKQQSQRQAARHDQTAGLSDSQAWGADTTEAPTAHRDDHVATGEAISESSQQGTGASRRNPSHNPGHGHGHGHGQDDDDEDDTSAKPVEVIGGRNVASLSLLQSVAGLDDITAGLSFVRSKPSQRKHRRPGRARGSSGHNGGSNTNTKPDAANRTSDPTPQAEQTALVDGGEEVSQRQAAYNGADDADEVDGEDLSAQPAGPPLPFAAPRPRFTRRNEAALVMFSGSETSSVALRLNEDGGGSAKWPRGSPAVTLDSSGHLFATYAGSGAMAAMLTAEGQGVVSAESGAPIFNLNTDGSATVFTAEAIRYVDADTKKLLEREVKRCGSDVLSWLLGAWPVPDGLTLALTNGLTVQALVRRDQPGEDKDGGSGVAEYVYSNEFRVRYRVKGVDAVFSSTEGIDLLRGRTAAEFASEETRKARAERREQAKMVAETGSTTHFSEQDLDTVAEEQAQLRNNIQDMLKRLGLS